MRWWFDAVYLWLFLMGAVAGWFVIGHLVIGIVLAPDPILDAAKAKATSDRIREESEQRWAEHELRKRGIR